LGLFTFQAEESFLAICLVNNHLYFLPTVRDIVQNLLLIVFMAGFTAYFPARRAAKISVTEALRHVE
jgi:ABC-type lipoprotein release transport system permease subunit